MKRKTLIMIAVSTALCFSATCNTRGGSMLGRLFARESKSARAGSASFEIESARQVSDVKRFGVNIGTWTSWGAEQLSSNVLKNPGFEGVIDRAIVIVSRADASGFSDDTAILARADGFWTGARFDVLTGTSAGRHGSIVESRQSKIDGSPRFLVDEDAPELAPGDVVALTRVSDSELPTQWWIEKDSRPLMEVNQSDRRPASPGLRSLALNATAGHAALLAFNVLRPRGRDRLGLSCGILGNGFALTRETLLAVPYTAVSLVEDLEYHLRLVRAGRRVRFADAVTVRAEMPAGGRGAKTQRARWEGGRFQMIGKLAPSLAKSVMTGRLKLIEPLLELLLLPLAFHVLLLLAALAVGFAPTRTYALAALAAVASHILAAIYVGGGGLRDLAALAAAPFYIAWKAALIPMMIRTAKKDAEWVRTERANSEGGRP